MAEDQHFSNFELVQQLEPWFPLFARIGEAALRDQLAAVPILGLPRKTECANDWHRAWRNNFRRVCDLAEDFVTLVEEPEGQGLDYLLFRMNPDKPFTMRWGRINGETIRRNRTARTREVHEQGTLFGVATESPSAMPNVTLGFTIEDYFTQVGQPCWWFGRLHLLRERADVSEFMTEVHVYPAPEQNTESPFGVPPPIVIARENEAQELEQMIENIRGMSA